NCSRLPRAADHAKKQKWFVDPVPEHQRVVAMAACHDQRKAWHIRKRQHAEFFPFANFESNFVWKKIVIRQRRAVIKNGYVEVQRQSQRRDRLGDVSGAGNPEGAWRSDGLAVKKSEIRVGSDDGKILPHAPLNGSLPFSQFSPKFLTVF